MAIRALIAGGILSGARCASRKVSRKCVDIDFNKDGFEGGFSSSAAVGALEASKELFEYVVGALGLDQTKIHKRRISCSTM